MIRRHVALALILCPVVALAQQSSSSSGGAMAPGSSVPDPTEAALNAGTLLGIPAPPQAPPSGGSTRGGASNAVGGGRLPSSSQGRAPGETDGFDFGRGGGSGTVARGSEHGPVYLDRSERPAAGAASEGDGRRASVVTVQKGDSLWSICDRELGNAYAWPKVWALNPKIENPHVLEPGQQLRLRADGADGEDGEGGGGNGRASLRLGASRTMGKGEAYSFQGRERTVAADAVFQLDEGVVEDDDGSVIAEIQGSPSDRLYLASGDEVWVKPTSKKKLEAGQVLVVQRPVEKTHVGTIVHDVGAVRITGMREGYTLARAVIVEATDVIERGMSLSNEPREFRAVPPRSGAPDVEARILGATHLHAFYGQHQVVFIDRGKNDKLEPGHSLYVDRQGDGLDNATSYREARTTVSLDSEDLGAEHAHQSDTSEALPNDRVAELRVVAVKPHSATCLVIRSRREIERTDVVRTHSAP
jgi:hypothetical protein